MKKLREVAWDEWGIKRPANPTKEELEFALDRLIKIQSKDREKNIRIGSNAMIKRQSRIKNLIELLWNKQ